MTITELAIKRPIIIIVLFLALTILGIFGYNQLKYDLFPDISIPNISISTNYSGASAREVEISVTKPIEDAISGLDKVDTITSTSQEGSSRVRVQFTPDANIDFSLQDAQRKVNQIIRKFPNGVDSPALSKVSLDDWPILTIGFTSNLPDTKFYQLMNDFIQPKLSSVGGVGQVNIIGGRQRQIAVNLDIHKMQSYGLSTLQVLQAVKGANLEFPAGTVKDNDSQFVIRLAGRFKTLDELKNLVISQVSTGGSVKLSNVAVVMDNKKDITSFTRINGKETIAITILKQSDANTVEVSRMVRQELIRLERTYRQINLKSDVVSDNATFIIDSANAVKDDLLLAILLVAGVMLLFLHSFRNSLIVMIAIPTSLVTTFIGMWALGFSLNIITLLALSLVIGILVDDAIVVLENIYRHLESGEDKQTASLKGRNEIGFTALSITMVDIVVYLPLAIFVAGIIGGMMRQFAIVIVISTLMSLFVSFTVTPMLASRFSRIERLTKGTLMGRFGIWFERMYKGLTEDYLKVLKIGLKNPGKVLLVAGILFGLALSLVPFGFIGSEFMPQPDQSQLNVDFELSPGANIEQTNQLARKMEGFISSIPEVVRVYTTVGANYNSSQDNRTSFSVFLVSKKMRKRSINQIGSLIRSQLRKIPEIVKSSVSQPSFMPGSGGSSPIQVAINGQNWEDVSQAADQVVRLITRVRGVSDVRLSSDNVQPEMQIEIDRDKMANLGLSMSDVAQTLQMGLTGNTDSKFVDRDDVHYDINVRLDQSARTHTSDVAGLTVANRSGQLIPINQFATIVRSTGPSSIQRRSRSYSISVNAQAVGRTSGDIGADIKKELGNEKFPPGVQTAFVGSLKNQSDSFASLGLALVAAIVFVYLIMSALYNSFIYPFAVLFSVPLGMIGALLALGLTKNSLAVFSIMGMIMQVGLVSKNAILLVDFTNKAREEGNDIKEALLLAGRERLRPILMTTFTMILGMLPLAISHSPGSEFKNSMGWVLIGGLICSMLMTLVVVPVVYTKVEQFRVFIFSLKRRLLTNRNESSN